MRKKKTMKQKLIVLYQAEKLKMKVWRLTVSSKLN